MSHLNTNNRFLLLDDDENEENIDTKKVVEKKEKDTKKEPNKKAPKSTFFSCFSHLITGFFCPKKKQETIKKKINHNFKVKRSLLAKEQI